jgi:hypothetical protein
LFGVWAGLVEVAVAIEVAAGGGYVVLEHDDPLAAQPKRRR